MQLKAFQITNYRSIADSGEISAARITALLGRNESGKTNLLRALATLNPPGEMESLDGVKDFPRNRKLSECDAHTKVVSSIWELDEDEWDELQTIWPRAEARGAIKVGRYYSAERWVDIPCKPLGFDQADITKKVKKVYLGAKAAASDLEDEIKAPLEAAADQFSRNATPGSAAMAWAKAAKPAFEAIEIAITKAGVELTDEQQAILDETAELAASILGDDEAHENARNWVVEKLPVFVYLDDYPEIEGHQDIAAYLDRKSKGNRSQADLNFEKMCKVADLDPARLHGIKDTNTEERNQLANRASAVISNELHDLWTDRKLKVRFNPDGNHLETFVADSTKSYDVEVNLDERSRGFRWFFGFYMTFAADTAGGDKDGAILLLDEPGLYLHAKSQGDLLRHLEDGFKNQIIYTTHSPFMVPTHHLEWVRTVNISEEAGTTVTDDPTGDDRTLFPLQAALGYDLAQSLFLGGSNLVVEGVTDYWFLSAASDYLASLGRTGLDPRLTITPAGGAQKVPYMVSLLASERLDVMVLLDHEKDAAATKEGLVKGKLLRDGNVVSIGDAFDDASRPAEGDVEDLLDAGMYEELVREGYANDLKGKKLSVNSHIPRIAKRMEAAFKDADLVFLKGRPSRLFLKKMGADPASVMTDQSLSRFERLFSTINERFEKHIARSPEPFS